MVEQQHDVDYTDPEENKTTLVSFDSMRDNYKLSLSKTEN